MFFSSSKSGQNDSNTSLHTYDGWLQIHKHSAGHVLSGAGLAEEGVEGVVAAADGLVAGHLSVRLDAMLQTVQLPACITDLHTGLSNVDRDTLTLKKKVNNN